MYFKLCLFFFTVSIAVSGALGAEPSFPPRLPELGSAVLLPESPVPPSSLTTLNLRYRVGEAGLRRGGSILIRYPYTMARFEFSVPQTETADREAYVKVIVESGKAKLSTEIGDETTVFEAQIAPKDSSQIIQGGNTLWCDLDFVRELFGVKDKAPLLGSGGRHYPITIKVVEGNLSEGDAIEIQLGKGKGVRMPTLCSPYTRLRIFVDPEGDGKYDGEIVAPPMLDVRRPDNQRFKITAPLQVESGKKFEASVVARLPYDMADVYRGIDTDYAGKITINVEGEKESEQLSEFRRKDNGAMRVDGLVIDEPGLYRISVSDKSSGISGTSHYIECAGKIESPVYWGDVHVHTSLSYDGWHKTGPEMAYPWANRIANLDFAAITDHTENNFTKESFELVKDLAKRYHDPGKFVTFPAYEWSAEHDNGGDHNVLFVMDDPPLFRHVDETSDGLAELLDLVKNEEVFVIPHFIGRAANWEIELDQKSANLARRVVEIYSTHQSSEFGDGLVNDGLKKWKMGFIGSGDGHESHPGDTYNVMNEWGLHGGLAAVRSPSLTRRALINGLGERNCYATSGERVFLEFTCDGKPMGSELPMTEEHVFRIKTFASANVAMIELIKDGTVFLSVSARVSEEEVTIKYKPIDEKESYFYARVTFEDGERAWSSPIWIAAGS
ncbi:DUF3604 domain-containing protein [Candidatus Hydrogenedentota bacterium]